MESKSHSILHFKSGKISVIIFLGPLLMELHFLFMNDYFAGFCPNCNQQTNKQEKLKKCFSFLQILKSFFCEFILLNFVEGNSSSNNLTEKTKTFINQD